ncbi:type IV pilin protein [Pseudomonas sp. NY15366]
MKLAQTGFTLIEVMLVVAVIGILVTIAYPSYTEYVHRANRSEGQALLADASARQERYFAQNNVYITSSSNIGKLGLGGTSETGKYTLSIASVDDDGGYTLTAEEKFGDTKCGDLTLNALGKKDRTGSGKSIEDCWK